MADITDQQTKAYKPAIIGLYGLSGSGKTTLMKKLDSKLDTDKCSSYEGSTQLESILDFEMAKFKKLDSDAKAAYRKKAIKGIQEQYTKNGKDAIVTGHYSFWHGSEDNIERAWTSADAEVYTHILYLDVPAKDIIARCQSDTGRSRDELDIDTVNKMLEIEQKELQAICREQGILFHLVIPDEVDKIFELIEDFRNLSVAEQDLDEALNDGIRSIVVLDADKTLASADGGALFWAQIPGRGHAISEHFHKSGHSLAAFQQASLLQEEVADAKAFDDYCETAAKKIKLHPEMEALIKHALVNRGQIGVVVVTCGVRRIWQKVLAMAKLDVHVIGGGRLQDGYVVTPQVKGELVRRLQDHHKLTVFAIGDSPLDLDMLKNADHAVVAVCKGRSKSMEDALKTAIEKQGDEGLTASQVLLPSTEPPRLNESVLPIIKLDQGFYDKLQERLVRFHYFSDTPATKVLTAPTRDASISGSRLRDAHRQAGWYLTVHKVSELLGTEEYIMRDVHGYPTVGHRVKNEDTTAIIPLMRGGEPMAFGVSDAMPRAPFYHAKHPSDLHLKPDEKVGSKLDGCSAVILVDWVINSGKSIIEFVRYIRLRLVCDAPIVVVAGVMQEAAEEILERKLAGWGKVDVVALRVSKNKYSGKGGTDTGHRLFNTTHLE